MIRIAVVTPLFPTRAEPYRGSPVSQTVLALQRRAQVEVFYVAAAFPRWRILGPRKFLYSAADPGRFLSGIRPTHISYPAFPLLSRPFNGETCARCLRPFLERARPEVILAYWLYPEGYGALLVGEKLGIPAILGVRGTDLRAVPDPLSHRLVKSALRRASFVITVSEELRQRAIGFGAPAGRVRTIRNGCDSSVFLLGERAAARARLGVPPDAQLALFVGRLMPVKGLSELTESVARLLPSHPRLQLVCLGEGILEQKLRARAAQADLAGHVRLLGSQSPQEVARWMAAANLLCLPSYSEGCPNAVLEALCCGRPVVASDIGGVQELVDASCAILVSPGDPNRLAAALAEGLQRSWDERAIAARFGRGWEDVARETYEVCRAVLPTGALAVSG